MIARSRLAKVEIQPFIIKQSAAECIHKFRIS